VRAPATFPDEPEPDRDPEPGQWLSLTSTVLIYGQPPTANTTTSAGYATLTIRGAR
jgi:hypothetical protein